MLSPIPCLHFPLPSLRGLNSMIYCHLVLRDLTVVGQGYEQDSCDARSHDEGAHKGKDKRLPVGTPGKSIHSTCDAFCLGDRLNERCICTFQLCGALFAHSARQASDSL